MISDYVPSTRRAYHYRAVSVIENSDRAWECEGCGSKEYLQVHHLDENYKNYEEKNLMVLCVDCHRIIHDGKIIPRRGKAVF